jgi:hypothetical protein
MSYPKECCHWNPDSKSFTSHLRLGLSNGLFTPTFPTKILYVLHLSFIPATCPEHLILNDFINRMIFGEYRAWRFYYLLSLLPCHFIPLRPKCLPQHSTPSPCVPSSMWDTRHYSHAKQQKLIFRVFWSLCFWTANWRAKILLRMTVNTPWLQSARNYFINWIFNCQVCSKYLAVSPLKIIY